MLVIQSFNLIIFCIITDWNEYRLFMIIAETNIIRMNTTRFVHRQMSVLLRRFWCPAALPVIVCIILAIRTPEWFVAAGALVFLIYPTLMMFAYFSISLNPEYRLMYKPVRISVTDCGINIKFYTKLSDDTQHNDVVYELDMEKHIPFALIAKVNRIGSTIEMAFDGAGIPHLIIADEQWENNDREDRAKAPERVEACFRQNGIEFA